MLIKLLWPGYISRVKVEDTRLKAKAKDTKKSKAKDSLFEDRSSRGQGQECLRPWPRTKDTGSSVLQKKGLQIFFFKRSPFHKRTQNY